MSATAADAPELSPLGCSACGAPVPLAEGDRVHCPHCGASVEIPKAHREARALTQREEKARAELEAIYRRLGRPPGLVLRLWGTTAGAIVRAIVAIVSALATAWKWLFLGVARLAEWLNAPRLMWIAAVPAFVLLLASYLGILWLRERSIAHGFDVMDLVPPAVVLGAIGLVLFAIGVVPPTLLRYLDAFAEVRLRVQAGLAATPPETASGAARCRRCGGALEVPKKALGVRCLYCRADNLVALPASWLVRATGVTSHRHAAAADALAEEREARSAAWLVARRELVRGLGVPGALAGLGLAYALLLPGEVRWGFWQAIAGPRVLLPERCSPLDDEADCPTGWTDALHVALRRGETATLVERHPDPKARHQQPREVRLLGGVLAATFAAEGPRRATFVAPASGWYRIREAGAPADWELKITPATGKPPPSPPAAARRAGPPADPAGTPLRAPR